MGELCDYLLEKFILLGKIQNQEQKTTQGKVNGFNYSGKTSRTKMEIDPSGENVSSC